MKRERERERARAKEKQAEDVLMKAGRLENQQINNKIHPNNI